VVSVVLGNHPTTVMPTEVGSQTTVRNRDVEVWLDPGLAGMTFEFIRHPRPRAAKLRRWPGIQR